MRIFKTKLFEKWARKESIKDEALASQALYEVKS